MARRFHFRTLGIALAVVAAQASAIGVYRWVEARRQASAGRTLRYERLADRRAPDVSLVDANGSQTRLSTLHGAPVVLHFWATWCPPCKAELPQLLALSRQLRDNAGPRLIALSVDGDWDVLRRYFGGQVPQEVMLDAGGTATQDYGVATLPDTYLLSADGALRVRLAGARDWSDPRLAELLLSPVSRDDI